jgi:hypothetical protein
MVYLVVVDVVDVAGAANDIEAIIGATTAL